MTQPIGPIPVQPPIPSILTTARDRTGEDFGVRVPVPADTALPGGDLSPSTYSWKEGLTWTPLGCVTSAAWPQCPDPEDLKDLPGDRTAVWVSPFWVYTPMACEWLLDTEKLNAEAEQITLAHTAYAMGRALWLGEGLPASVVIGSTTYVQPTLRRSATDVSPGGTALDLDDTIAQLLASYETGTGGSGGAVIHLPSILATAALGGVPGGAKVMNLEGQMYRGPLYSLVSPGPGYPWGASVEGADGYGPLVSSGPEVYQGNTADEVWVYVTGPVEYALGQVRPHTLTPGSGLRRNKHEVYAERQAIVRFDPCAAFGAKAVMPVTGEGS